MKNIFFYSWLCFFCMNATFAQEFQNANWVFGEEIRLDFSNPPGFLPVNAAFPSIGFNGLEGCASVSDRTGNLLFVSDGVNLWHHIGTGFNPIDFTLVTNGLLGSPSSVQNVIFIPVPDNNHSYYIATINGATTAPGIPTERGLYYARIDIDDCNAVQISDNIALRDDDKTLIDQDYHNVSEAISSTLHSDSHQYWLIAHVQNDSHGGNLLSYEVTATGIGVLAGSFDHMPSASEPYTLTPGLDNYQAFARTIKISPDQNWFVLTTQLHGILLGNFNWSNGHYVNLTHLEGTDNFYGADFSANSDEVYYTSLTPSRIYERPIPSLSPSTSSTAILGIKFRGVQLAMDNRIFISTDNPFVTFINNPSDLSNPLANIIDLDPKSSRFGLPQWVWKQHPPCENVLIDNDDIAAGIQEVREERSRVIQSTSRVNDLARLSYHAGSFIELLPDVSDCVLDDIGFEAVFGSQFVAEIVPCGSPFDYRPVGENSPPIKTNRKIDSRNRLLSTQLQIFPNPSDKSITIAYKGSMLKSIRIVSMDGKTMLDKVVNANSYEIEVSAFAKGIYLVNVETEDGKTLQSKFVKN